MTNSHYSVLLEKSIELLDIKPDGVYVDGTLGRGGHTKEILAKLGSNGKLIAFDKDLAAHDYVSKHINDKRMFLIHDSFANVDNHLLKLGFAKVNGVLLDLGVSSPQIDDASRGFSFRFDAPLDMRMDNSQGQSARQWINKADETELADVLWRYGEEKFSRKIAKAIVQRRQIQEIVTTKELVDIIEKALPFKEIGKNPATRSFQAIRIFINNELSDLESLLVKIPDILAVNGKVVVISFHSLEDRIVKTMFNELARPGSLPKWVTEMPKAANYKIIAKKLKADAGEVKQNIRSRSSILRAIERIS